MSGLRSRRNFLSTALRGSVATVAAGAVPGWPSVVGVGRGEDDRYRARGICTHGDTQISEAKGLIIGKYDLPVVGGTQR